MNNHNTFCITELRMFNFRNYADKTININSPRVMIYGENGSGKTNILEGLSLFTVGTGLRNTKLLNMQMGGWTNNQHQQPWAVHLQFNDGNITNDLGTAMDGAAANKGREKRIIHANSVLSQQSSLSEYLSVLWHTPKMDRLFSDGITERRRFFDRLVYGFYPKHLTYLRTFESARRERTNLFEKNIASKDWHRGIEEILINSAIEIAKNRISVINTLNNCTIELPFRRALLSCTGLIEDMLLTTKDQNQIHSEYQNILEKHREFGKTVGSHQAVFSAFDNDKGVDASQCSTGEQKIFILSIQLRVAHLLAKTNNTLLLLDDITSHLDKNRCEELCQTINNAPFNTWISTINPENMALFNGENIALENASKVQMMEKLKR